MGTLLVLYLAFQSASDMSIHDIYDKYQSVLPTLQQRYSYLRIVETKSTPNENDTLQRTGIVCGEYLTITSKSAAQEHEAHTFLSRQRTYSIRKNRKSNEWILQNYVVFNTGAPQEKGSEYQRERAKVQGLLPDAFILPFSCNGRTRWLDVLEKLKSGHADVVLHSIEKVGALLPNSLRITYSTNGPDRKVASTTMVELAPDMKWVITKSRIWRAGAQRGRQWDLEYGDPVDGVPILKKCAIYEVAKDASTGEVIPYRDSKPIIIEVNAATPCDTVDESQYDPRTYGIAVPEYWNPNRALEIPPGMYVALGGLVLFIAGVLLLHYSRRSAKSEPISEAGSARAI